MLDYTTKLTMLEITTLPELDALKTMKKDLVHGVVFHGCSVDDVIKGIVTKAVARVERAVLKEPKFSFGPRN